MSNEEPKRREKAMQIGRVKSEKEKKAESLAQISKKTVKRQGRTKFDYGNSQTSRIISKRVEDS